MNLTPITAQELECTTEWVECSCHFINARYSCVESPPPRMFDPILDVMNGFSGKIGPIVPLGRAIFLIIPGTSSLATIGLSLRDKRHSSLFPTKKVLVRTSVQSFKMRRTWVANSDSPKR